MANISRSTATEKIFDVIYETGLKSPRSSIRLTHKLSAYHMTEAHKKALTPRLNDVFQSYGIQLSVDAVVACKTVGDIVDAVMKVHSPLEIQPFAEL